MVAAIVVIALVVAVIVLTVAVANKVNWCMSKYSRSWIIVVVQTVAQKRKREENRGQWNLCKIVL